MEPAKKMENQETKNSAEQQPDVEIETTVEQSSRGVDVAGAVRRDPKCPSTWMS